jgi:molybdopterin molybdotransferase
MSARPWSSVLSDCMAHLHPLGSESVPRRAVLGRLLAGDILADRDYPHGDLSTMDGYAIADDRQEVYEVVGENSPGNGPGDPLETGTARRIFTGAELPQGASRVVPQEATTRDGHRLRISQHSDAAYTRRKGSEAREGDVVLKSGTRMGPVEQSLLATIGVSGVQVAMRPRVVHIVTGDEVVDPDSTGPGSSIRDSNSDLVAATLSRRGYDVAAQHRIGDDRQRTIQIVAESAEGSDVLLVSGGASVGDHDHARAALEAAGFQFLVHGVNLRPGKPVGIARRNNQWAVALPGNPVSHLVSLNLFVIPILRGLEGEKEIEPAFIEGTLYESLTMDVPRRTTLWPARAQLKDGRILLVARRFLSSGDLIGIAGVNALILFPEGIEISPAGAKALFLPLDSSWFHG